MSIADHIAASVCDRCHELVAERFPCEACDQMLCQACIVNGCPECPPQDTVPETNHWTEGGG